MKEKIQRKSKKTSELKHLSNQRKTKKQRFISSGEENGNKRDKRVINPEIKNKRSKIMLNDLKEGPLLKEIF